MNKRLKCTEVTILVEFFLYNTLKATGNKLFFRYVFVSFCTKHHSCVIIQDPVGESQVMLPKTIEIIQRFTWKRYDDKTAISDSFLGPQIAGQLFATSFTLLTTS